MRSESSRVALRDRTRDLSAIAPEQLGPQDFGLIAREFPDVAIEAPPRTTGRAMTITVEAWRDPTFDWWAFDRAIDRAVETNGLALVLEGARTDLPSIALEVLTRCQRVLRRRNRASSTALFDAVLERHRAVHDLALPLVQADYDHALDVWQWILRLEPDASLAVQLAALFHDFERLTSEAERRIEQYASDYLEFKDRHAARGAELAAALLHALRVPEPVVCRVARLIATHERQSGEGGLALLNDADALSFFSLNSAGFADYHEPTHVRTKIAHSLDRLRPAARRRLAQVRLRPDVRAELDAALERRRRPAIGSIRRPRPQKLVIFGLTVSSSWGNGHATIWRGLCRALGRAGHRVVFFERDVHYYAQHRDLEAPDQFELILYSTFGEIAARARRELAEADVAFVTSYCPDAREASETLEASRVPVRVFYDLDTPVTLARLDRGETIEYLPEGGLGAFDLVLSYTGGAALDELCDRLGARAALPLYGSVDPENHRPTPTQERYRCDLSYLGTWAADRQARLQALLLEPARRLDAGQFLIGGALYPADFPWAPNIRYIEHVPPPDHPAFYCSSRLTLSITRAAMAAKGYCPSPRLFEAAACGVPIVSDWWEGLDRFLEPGREILIARSSDEALAALERPAVELERIAAAARARTLAEHTAERRAAQLIDYLGGAA